MEEPREILLFINLNISDFFIIPLNEKKYKQLSILTIALAIIIIIVIIVLTR